jgi:probable HAF family extracellular repeat protein
VPGSLQTVAFGINDRGQIAGGYTTADGHQRGFLLTGRRYTTIDAPGGTDNIAVDINDRGEIVVPDPRATALLPIGTGR